MYALHTHQLDNLTVIAASKDRDLATIVGQASDKHESNKNSVGYYSETKDGLRETDSVNPNE